MSGVVTVLNNVKSSISAALKWSKFFTWCREPGWKTWPDGVS